MSEKNKFYTLKGYALLENNAITSSMEDYLEMIYRIHSAGEAVRIGALAENLNVKPSSASKMVGNLKKQGFVSSEKYGYIKLTDEGSEFGKYLVFRHDTLHRLLCHINRSENEVEQVEKIEHFINAETVENIKNFLDGLEATSENSAELRI
ncbi:MAG: metal-dependent transcriptional regulator [Defluviitaleaceae bacterium]|nr:metal-dependent transcriptional regulator [Defluviitaleaceae bacterium]